MKRLQTHFCNLIACSIVCVYGVGHLCVCVCVCLCVCVCVCVAILVTYY